MPVAAASAAVYARISSDLEGTALGVLRQLEDCRQLARELGWTIGEEYVDNDLSAYSGRKRPAYERMLEDLSDGLRDAVLVYHEDRLTRRPVELERFVDVAAAAGAQVRFVVGGAVDLADGDALLKLRIMSAVAANESAAKSRRVKRKLEQVAAEGRPHGGSNRPFGFEDDKITIRPDEAEIIRQLVARFLAGERTRSLARWLDDEGIRTVRGGPWRTPTLKSLFGEPSARRLASPQRGGGRPGGVGADHQRGGASAGACTYGGAQGVGAASPPAVPVDRAAALRSVRQHALQLGA
jgi:site-specific DNA recombinase